MVKTFAVEMVCLGNICRSPMAAAVLHNKALALDSPKLIVSSSGTSDYHIGEGAHKYGLADVATYPDVSVFAALPPVDQPMYLRRPDAVPTSER